MAVISVFLLNLSEQKIWAIIFRENKSRESWARSSLKSEIVETQRT